MRSITLAATQMSCSWNIDENIAKAEKLVREAASRGANIILLQELFETPYFCLEENPDHFKLAKPHNASRVVTHFSALARELNIVLPISYFEEAGPVRFNSITVIDADGSLLCNYRKSHIPEGPGYQEKFYFSPGDTGFQIADTKFGRLGCGICWDQWFPETARCLALKGAEILAFPTAIGSEPKEPNLDSSGPWRRVMQGHAAANMMPLIASNRVGKETDGATSVTFYGTSFIADHTGEILADADRVQETVILATVDLDVTNDYRASWGVFRDRRPGLYHSLRTLDGETLHD